MIQSISLLPGITLQCFPDSRFKQGCLSVQLLRPMAGEEAALNALLPAVLLRGTVRDPDLRCITQHLDDLYGAAVSTVVRRVGDYQTTGLYCSFIDDRFAFSSDRVLEPMIQFLGELLLQPLTVDGCFHPEFVESEKRNLIAAIHARRNDKRLYASDRLMALMCKADSFGIPRLGDAENVARITPKILWDHYLRLLRESPIALFYVGSAAPETVANALKAVFTPLQRQVLPLPSQSSFRDGGDVREEERMEVSQGKLAMGFVTPITLRHPEFVAMQVCNTVLGAGMTSKLFMNIREKNSLCYDIGSGYHGSKGIVAVSAGIDFDKKDAVCRQVEAQLADCAAGNISDAELSAAEEALLSSLRGTHDSPGAIEGYYATAALSGMSMTPAQYMDAVAAVSREDVARAAQTLRLHSVYFLRGVQ